MKRVLSVAIMLALCLCMLCGCKNKETKKKTDDSSDKSTSDTTVATYDDVYGDKNFRDSLSLFQYDDFSQYITLAEYKGREYPASLAVISDDEITNYINALLEQSELGTAKEVTGRAVKNGDTVNIDFEGKKDGVAFEGGTSKGYDLVIGSNSFIEGFESGLIGANVGQTLDLNLTFPESYHNADLAGKPVVFTVTVNSIKETVMPELTDKIVTQVSKTSKTVDEFKAEIRTLLESDVNFSILNEIFPKVLEESKFISLPEKEVKFFTDYVLNDYVNQYGVSAEDETIAAMAKEQGESLVKYYLMYFSIVEKEGLSVSDSEYKDAFNEALKLNSIDVESAKKMDKDVFYMSLIYDKASKAVLDSAVKK